MSPITCMASAIVHTLLSSTWRTPGARSWYDLNSLNQDIVKVLRIIRLLSNTSRQHVPGIVYCIEVWRHCYPVNHTDTLVIKEGHAHLSCLGTCIILHQNECITNSACIWPADRLQNIIAMSCFRYTTSNKHIQVCRPFKDISAQTMTSPQRTSQLWQCYSLRNVLPGVSTP